MTKFSDILISNKGTKVGHTLEALERYFESKVKPKREKERIVKVGTRIYKIRRG